MRQAAEDCPDPSQDLDLKARRAMEAARDHLLAIQREDGHWCGELEGDSILGSDFNVALVGLLFATVLTLASNLAADVIYGWLDPRISY